MPTNTLNQPDIAARTIELLSGQEVIDLLGNPAFMEQWDWLYQACPWGTVFQSSRFVAAWYHTYEKDYLPILIKDTQDGQLTGLLTLAIPKSFSSNSKIHNRHLLIMGAGMYDAEYQTWLALPQQSERFITQAFHAVKRRFPKKDILLRFLPPGVPLDWISKNPRWKKTIEIQAFKRPIMDLQATDVARMFRKAEFRNKLNRLKRLGKFSFEQITELTALQAILGELTVQYDFRQGAMFNLNQFRDNPLKAAFLLEMFKQGLLHVTVLKVDEQVIACIMAVQYGDWVHLAGINIHSPFYGQCSPGFVHFLLLGQWLAQEGILHFDLTPGGDPYKERMANRHDVVHELVICNNVPYRAKRFIRKNMHNLLTKAGVRPMAFELMLEKRSYLLKARLRAMTQRSAVAETFLKLKARLKGSKVRYTPVVPTTGTFPGQIQQNNLSDLLNYEQGGRLVTRWEFMEEAMHRFEAGQRSYTWSDGGVLRACVWLSPATPRHKDNGLPEGASVLENLYYHPDRRTTAHDFVATVAASVASAGHVPVYLATNTA